MVTVESGKCNYVHFQIIGCEAEYIAKIRALVTALAAVDDADTRKDLAELLLEMLPKEHQIKL